MWRIRVGDAEGQPGDVLATPAGPCSVVIEADMKWPDVRVTARLDLKTNVECGRLTNVRIPTPEPLIEEVSRKYRETVEPREERTGLDGRYAGSSRAPESDTPLAGSFASTSPGHAAASPNERVALTQKTLREEE